MADGTVVDKKEAKKAVDRTIGTIVKALTACLMRNRLLSISAAAPVAALICSVGAAHAQAGVQNAGQAAAAPQQTPPIAPKVEDIKIPTPLTIPPPPSQAPEVQNRPITADEASRIALRYQPNITAARAGVSAAQGRTQQVRSGLLPGVGVSAGYTNLQTLAGSSSGSGSGSNTGSGITSSITIRQLLFDFNHTRDLVRQTSLLEQVALSNLTRVQYDIVFQVKQAFYQYTQSTELLRVNEANVANRQAQLALARARLNSGLGLPSDVITAETALDEAVTNLVTARNNETLARINLALLMGIDPRTPLVAAPSSEPILNTDDVQSMVNQALRQRPEVRQANAQIISSRYGISAAKTTSAPSIGVSAGLGSRGDQFFPGNDTLNVGVTLQFTPFDAGLTAGRVREARANLETAQAQLASVQLTVVSDVSQSYTNLRNAEKRLVAANTEVTNAEEGVRIAEGRFRSGLGLFLDIINAQSALFTARTNQATARSSVDQSRAALSRALGAPLAR